MPQILHSSLLVATELSSVSPSLPPFPPALPFLSVQQVLNQGTGPDTPVVWTCPVGRDWTLCHIRFVTSGAPKPSLQFQMSAAGTIWLDDVSLLASCDHPATPPAMTYSLPPAVRASYWRFTILDSWNPDGTYAPEPAKGEGPAVEYIQFKNATSAAGAEEGNGKQHEEGVAATEAEGCWITETADWTVSGQYHPNGPISHLIAPCDGGFWNAGATPQPWSATVALPGVRARACVSLSVSSCVSLSVPSCVSLSVSFCVSLCLTLVVTGAWFQRLSFRRRICRRGSPALVHLGSCELHE